MDWGTNQINEWRHANGAGEQTTTSARTCNNGVRVRWKAPQGDCLKLNVDASIVQDSSSFSVGWILRNHVGDFKGGRVMKINMKASVLEAEAIGILEALSWVMDRTDSKVCIESDSLTAVQAINRGIPYQLELGHIFDECRLRLTSRSSLSLNHVRRLANRVAHTVARFPCELNCYVDFMSPPRQVLDSMMYDLFSE
ncbi:hypothetical protein DCAR_0100346 [Daucus carota subsp. sativus]|uniref:RNase H type-1 domain-containing protein n=1 Tax=Daucus carota subsp. sativus TaxID=79200 RepID=A0AAF0W0S7_DAUCS|nr:hypothetical protein DCAR_0100346 [Daucus carota subsp. sativus]